MNKFYPDEDNSVDMKSDNISIPDEERLDYSKRSHGITSIDRK